MSSVISSIAALMLGVALLQMGSGLQGTLLGIRGALETFSPFAIGLVMTGYYAGFALGCMFGARTIERVGHIRAFAAFASVASAVVLVFPIFADAPLWIVMRVLTGYCFAILYMAIESWLNGRVPNEHRGRLLAVYMIVNLGALAAGQQLLNLSAPGGFVLFILASVLVSVALVPIALSASAAPAAVPSDRMTLGELYEISPLAVVGAFAVGLVNGAMWGLVPLWGLQTGLDTNAIATVMSVIVLGGMILQWPVGRLSDMADRRMVVVGTSLVLAAASGGLFFAGGLGFEAVLAIAFFFGGMAFVAYPLCAAHINDRILHEDLIQANAALLLVLGVGAAAGPLIAGLVMSRFGPGSLFAFACVVALLFAGFGAYRLRVREAAPPDEQVAFEPVSPVPTTPVLDPRIDPEDIERRG